MPSRARLDWRGEQLAVRMRAAACGGVNETVDAMRDEAKATHDPMWVNRPTKWSKEGGQLEEEIGSRHTDADMEKVHGPDPVASFGFARKRGFYGLFHEVGTIHEIEKPVLRPVFDALEGTLLGRIKRRLRT